MRSIMLASLALVSVCLVPAVGDNGLGTYEVSYMYNAMYGGGSGGPGNPEGSMYYAGTWTSPVLVGPLEPGSYDITVVPGRLDGNPAYNMPQSEWSWYFSSSRPSELYPDTGYNGGLTSFTHVPYLSYGSEVWVGTSTAASAGTRYGVGLGTPLQVDLAAGESIWFSIHDWYIGDNFGGTTVTCYAVAGDDSPELGTWLLLACTGGLGAAVRRRRKKT